MVSMLLACNCLKIAPGASAILSVVKSVFVVGCATIVKIPAICEFTVNCNVLLVIVLSEF